MSGRITKDIKLRYTATGKANINFSLAVDSGWGENKKTLWVNCKAWEKTAEVMAANLGKGRKVLVEGELDQYDTEKDGVKKRVDQIVVRNFEFMDSKKEQVEQPVGQNMAGGYDTSSFGKDVFPNEEIDF